MIESADRIAQLTQEVERLTEQLALQGEALENMQHGLCMFDSENRIALCNRQYPEVLSLPSDLVQPGMSINDLIELGIEAGLHGDVGSGAELDRLPWTNLGADDRQGRYLRRDGRVYAVQARRTPRGNVVSTFTDVTDRLNAELALRGSEARLSAILESMPDCVKIFDEGGTLIQINRQGLEQMQAPDLQALSAPGYTPLPAEYRERHDEMHRRVMAGETVSWTYELVGLKGRRRHMEARGAPFRMPDGSRVHMCISRDVNERVEAENATRLSEERLRLVHEVTGLAEFETSREGAVICSRRLMRQLGLSDGEDLSRVDQLLEVIHPEDRDRVREGFMQALAECGRFQCEFRIVRQDTGEIRWISSHAHILRDAQGNANKTIGAYLDITDRKRAEEALRESEERFRLAAEAAELGIWDYDLATGRRDWSPRLLDIFGLPAGANPSLEEAAGRLHPRDRERFLKILRELRDEAGTDRFRGTYRLTREDDGGERWITVNCWKIARAGRLDRIILTVRDVTEDKRAEERIRWNAVHDPLTKLANRAGFQDWLEKAVKAAERNGNDVGLLLLDLDHFKQINDALGHDAGDKLLQMFAKRLKSVVRSGDTVARFGGDEFAIILPRLPSRQVLAELCEKIHQQLREPFIHAGRMLDCRVSIGAATYPEHGQSTEELMKNADMALYAAKGAGRSNTIVFKPHFRDDVRRRSVMVRTARAAIHEERILPYYQPKLDLRRGTITGFEALLRWRDDAGVIHYPATLSAAFEDHDVAADISERVIECTVADMRSWLDRGIPFDHVAVNASAAEFRRDNFAERVLEALVRADIPASCFQLEVAETVFLGRGAEYVRRALELLSTNGAKIALDDFGTGYASLRHLKQFPVDMIKIDQSFIRGMESDSGDEAIIRAVINLGRSLGIKTVAEGIERMSQAERLIELGCDYGQGFLFSKAVPGDRVPALLASASGRLSYAPNGDLRLAAGND